MVDRAASGAGSQATEGENVAAGASASLQESLRKLHAVESSRESFAHQAVRLLAKAANAQAAALLISDHRASRVRLVACTGAPPAVFKPLLTQSGVWIALRPLNERRINVILKAHQNPFVPQNLVTSINPQNLGIAVIPFYNANIPIGVLVLFSTHESTFSQSLLHTVAQALRVCGLVFEDAFEGRGHRRIGMIPSLTPEADLTVEVGLAPGGPQRVREEPKGEFDSKRIAELEAELDNLRKIREQLPELQAEVERLDREAQQAREAAEAARARAARLEVERAEAENRARAAAEMLQALMDAREAQQRRIEETLRLAKIHTETVTDLDAQLQILTERVQWADEVEARLRESETARAELEDQVRELSAVVRKNEELDARLRTAEAARADLAEQLARAQARIADLTRAYEEKREELREHAELLEAARGDMRLARERLTVAETECERLRNEQLGLRRDLDSMMTERAALREALHAVQAELAKKVAEQAAGAAAWNERVRTLEVERDRLKAEVLQLRDTFKAAILRLHEQVEEGVKERHQLEVRLANLTGVENEAQTLRSQVTELQQQVVALRAIARDDRRAVEGRAGSEDAAAIAGGLIPPRLGARKASVAGDVRAAGHTNGAYAETSVLRVEAARIDALLDSIEEIEANRARTHREVYAMTVLRDQLNAWRTQFVERERSGPEGDGPLDDHTYHKAFATQSAHIVRQLTRLIENLTQQDCRLAAVSCDLQQKIDALRLVPLETIFRRLQRPVRDAARQEDKSIQLVVEGGNIQVDRSVIEPLHAALLHLVRNAVVHGIEPRAVRGERGKPEQGTVRLVARVLSERDSRDESDEGAPLVLEVAVADDGAGIDVAAVLRRARERGLVAPEETPDDDQLREMIFAPGFSTAPGVNGLAGRGVGMDIVRQEVAGLGGTVEARSEFGRGTTFMLRVPVRTAVQ